MNATSQNPSISDVSSGPFTAVELGISQHHLLPSCMYRGNSLKQSKLQQNLFKKPFRDNKLNYWPGNRELQVLPEAQALHEQAYMNT